MTTNDIKSALKSLGLYGVLARFEDFADGPWLEGLVDIEREERARRSLERRLRRSRLGSFKSIADFEWSWPDSIDRELIEEMLTLSFVGDRANVILIGPSGVGKTTIAKNIGHEALRKGMTVLHTTASAMLQDLVAQDSTIALQKRMRRYVTPAILIVDELGYLSYDTRHGDLFFDVVSRRHEQKPIVLTTNKPFAEWNETFASASCITAMIDRLVHRAEIITIDGESYRKKEAEARAKAASNSRRKRKGAMK